jgi:hypothetical protein
MMKSKNDQITVAKWLSHRSVRTVAHGLYRGPVAQVGWTDSRSCLVSWLC